MKKMLGFGILLVLVSFFSRAQDPALFLDSLLYENPNDTSMIVDSLAIDSTITRWQHLQIAADFRLDTVLNIHIEENKKVRGMEGYRVQIFTSSRSANPHDEAKTERERFLAKYSDYKVHIKFLTPDFYVRIGDFRSRSEALKLLALIQNDYPDAFVVVDQIEYPD